MNALSIQNSRLSITIHNNLTEQLNAERELFLNVQRDVQRLYDDVVRMQQQNVEETEELRSEFLSRLCKCSRKLNSISFIPGLDEMKNSIRTAIKAIAN
jgi:hypothetical protein